MPFSNNRLKSMCYKKAPVNFLIGIRVKTLKYSSKVRGEKKNPEPGDGVCVPGLSGVFIHFALLFDGVRFIGAGNIFTRSYNICYSDYARRGLVTSCRRTVQG